MKKKGEILMPNLKNNMSGQKLIEEVNHSIDERGKLQEDGNYGGTQEINGKLNITNGITVGGKSVIPELYKEEDNKFIDELMIKKSDINIARDMDGKVQASTITKTIKFANPYSDDIKVNAKFQISNQNVNEFPTPFDGIDFNLSDRFYISITAGSKSTAVKASGSLILKKDDEIIWERAINLSDETYSYSREITLMYESTSSLIPLKDVNGEYEFDISLSLTNTEQSYLYTGYGGQLYLRAQTAKRIF